MLLFFPTQENLKPRQNGDKEKHPIQHFLQVIIYTFIFGNCCSYVLYNTLNNKSNGAVFLTTEQIKTRSTPCLFLMEIWYNKISFFIIPYSTYKKWLGA